MAWYNRINPFASVTRSRTLIEVIRDAGYDPMDVLYSSTESVSRDRAATMTAMNRAVTLLAGSMADSIVDSVQAIDITTKKAVKGNRAVDRVIGLLTDTPDGVQPSLQFLEDAATDLLASGSAVFVSTATGLGRSLSLANPIMASGHTDTRGRVSFDLTTDDDVNGGIRRYPENRVIIARWPRFAGRTLGSTNRTRWFGFPPIQTIKTALLLALNAEKWASAIFDRRSGAIGSDYAIVYDRALPPAAAENVYKMLKAFGEGRSPLVLTEGAKVHKMAPTPQDADLLGLRKFQIGEVARVYGVPSVLIGMEDGGNVWGSSLQALFLAYQRYGVRPFVNRFLAPLSHRLLPSGLRLVVDESRSYRGDATALKAIFDAGRPDGSGKPALFSRSELRSIFGLESEFVDDWDMEAKTDGDA